MGNGHAETTQAAGIDSVPFSRMEQAFFSSSETGLCNKYYLYP
jgi:hypothetical protein